MILAWASPLNVAGAAIWWETCKQHGDHHLVSAISWHYNHNYVIQLSYFHNIVTYTDTTVLCFYM